MTVLQMLQVLSWRNSWQGMPDFTSFGNAMREWAASLEKTSRPAARNA